MKWFPPIPGWDGIHPALVHFPVALLLVVPGALAARFFELDDAWLKVALVPGVSIVLTVLSGIVVYGPECRPTLVDNEVCGNRESGVFVFAGARPYVTRNVCFQNHHFGIAVRDPDTKPDLVRNVCRDNRLSGILLFHHAEALMLDNVCRDNDHWGVVMTSDSTTSPPPDELGGANALDGNPRGAMTITDSPLADIGR